jgi:hypothetical protein
MKEDLIFVGYRSFMSKSNNECNVLDFITKPKLAADGESAYVSNVSVFTNKEKYENFIDNTKLLSIVPISFEINGNKVRYSI